MDDQDNDQSHVNVFQNIDATQEAPVTFQCGLLSQERNDDLDARSQATEFLRKVFKRIAIKTYRNNCVGEGSENAGQHINYGRNETVTVTVTVKKIFKKVYLLCGEHKELEAQC